MVYGDGGAGKTTLCLDLACHLAGGDEWLGIDVAAPLSVLLIENEGPTARCSGARPSASSRAGPAARSVTASASSRSRGRTSRSLRVAP